MVNIRHTKYTVFTLIYGMAKNDCISNHSAAAIEEIAEWSIDRSAVTTVICSIDKNKTTVGHSPKEFSCLLCHFLTHGG